MIRLFLQFFGSIGKFCIAYFPLHKVGLKLYTANFFFNLTSNNPALEESSLKTGCFAFYQRKVSPVEQADLSNMFKKVSKNVCVSAVVVFLTPCLLLLQAIQLEDSRKHRRGP